MNDPALPPVPPLPEDVRRRALRTVLEGVAAEPARRRSRGRHLQVAAAAAAVGVVLASAAAALSGPLGEPGLDLPPAAPATTTAATATTPDPAEADRALQAACRARSPLADIRAGAPPWPARPPVGGPLTDFSPGQAADLHSPDGAPVALVAVDEAAGLIGYCIEDPVLGLAVRVQQMRFFRPEVDVGIGEVYYGSRIRGVQVLVPADTVHAEITMGDGRIPTPCTLTAGFATCTTGVDETASDPENRQVSVTATTASGRPPVVVWRD